MPATVHDEETLVSQQADAGLLRAIVRETVRVRAELERTIGAAPASDAVPDGGLLRGLDLERSIAACESGVERAKALAQTVVDRTMRAEAQAAAARAALQAIVTLSDDLRQLIADLDLALANMDVLDGEWEIYESSASAAFAELRSFAAECRALPRLYDDVLAEHARRKDASAVYEGVVQEAKQRISELHEKELQRRTAFMESHMPHLPASLASWLHEPPARYAVQLLAPSGGPTAAADNASHPDAKA